MPNVLMSTLKTRDTKLDSRGHRLATEIIRIRM